MVDVASWSELREEDLKRENRELRTDAERVSEELDRLRAEVVSLQKENASLNARLNECAGGTKRDLAKKLEQQQEKNARLTQQLAAANGRVERMKKTITKALNLVPADDGAGGLIYDHHSADGEYIGTEQVDPMWVIQGMCETLQAALSDLPVADKEKS